MPTSGDDTKRYNGADEYIYNQTETNDTIRMSKEDVHDFDGITIDQDGQEVDVERETSSHQNSNWYRSSNDAGPRMRVFNMGSGLSLGVIVLLVILFLVLVIGGFIAFSYFFWPVLLIIGLVWLLLSAFGS